MNGQNIQENLDKYWNYKSRLQSKFIYVAEGEPSNTYYTSGAGIPVRGKKTESHAKWADSGQTLSSYIISQATEYKLLQMAGKSTQAKEAEKEIARCLAAFDRLDYYGDSYFSDNCEPSLNGFFIRDDVNPDNVVLKKSLTIESIESDYHYGVTMNGMSHDQVLNLMVSFVLVERYCKNSTNTFHCPALNQELTVYEWVKHITNRIYNGAFKKKITIAHVGSFWENAWVITNRCTRKVDGRGTTYAEIYPYSFPHAELYKTIMHTSLTWPELVSFTAISLPIPYFTIDINLEQELHPHIDYKRLLPSAVLNTGFCTSLKSTMNRIETCARAYSNDSKLFAYEHLPLLRQLTNNLGPIDISVDGYWDYWAMITFIEHILDDAPVNGPGSIVDHPHWSNVNRLIKPHGHQDPIFKIFNGLDYMMLHNLYWLNYYQSTPESQVVTGDFPKTINFADTDQEPIVGDSNTPLHLSAKSNLEAECYVKQNGELKLSAPIVVLKPGFEVAKGANFQAGNHQMQNTTF